MGLKTEKYSVKMQFYFMSYPKEVLSKRQWKTNSPVHIKKRTFPSLIAHDNRSIKDSEVLLKEDLLKIQINCFRQIG